MRSLFVFLFFFSSVAWSIGFKNGNQMQTVSIQGQVNVTCSNGGLPTTQVTYSCRDTVLEPGAYDYFVGPVIADATEARLHVAHADGSTMDKSFAYDGMQGQSKTLANLWIKTLFQYPLLALGNNDIHFVLLNKRGQSLAVGEFIATVARGNPRACQSTFYNSADPADCDSQYSVCQRYFEQFNNCR